MNDLRVFTRATATEDVFETYWSTGLEHAGRFVVQVPRGISDGRVAAELAVVRHLLIVSNACGHDKAGAGLRLWFSSGAVRKLMKGDSAKQDLAPYAVFLRNRFLGAEVHIETRPSEWLSRIAGMVDADPLDARCPARETIDLTGVGEVELTAHAMEQYVERFGKSPIKAWRELKKRAAMATPHHLTGRRAAADAAHRRMGRFYLEPNTNMLLTLVDGDSAGAPPKLVTICKNVRELSPVA